MNLDTLANSQMHIIQRRPFSVLRDAIRNVPLAGDKAIRPYSGADIRLELRKAENVAPTAYYVLKRSLEQVLRLRDALANKGLDLFRLDEWLEVEYGGARFPIAPPIIEEYVEQESGVVTPVAALVDGLHRVFAAREQGLDILGAVVSGASEPLVPMPLRWDEVRVVDEVPGEAGKRRYRYPDVRPFPFDRYPDARHLGIQQQRYFFYRDLSHFGSRGVRVEKDTG